MPRLLLASTSSYRREMLARLRLPFDAVRPEVDETPLPGESAANTASRLASVKARSLIGAHPQALIIGSDQVALLDVDLDTMNGISLGKQLRQCSPEICLVYVSAYLEFAPEGYTVNAFRYILKRDLDCQLPRCLDAILHEQDHRAPKTLTIRQNRTETELPYDSIYYLESDLRKINVYGDVAHQPLCSYYGKLNELPQALFENGFLRVWRSAVVNMKYIRQISSYMVTLRNGVKLGVSRNGYAEIRSTYLEWKGQFGDD